MYPLCILGLVLWAMIPSETVGFTIVLGAIALPVVGGCLVVGYNNKRHMNNKRRLARSLVDADLALFGAKEDWPALREAFDLFDIDNSGDIDSGEVRALLVEMYPRMPMRHRNAALQLRSGGDQVRFEDFDETILEWRKYASENDPDGNWKAMRVLGATLKTAKAVVANVKQQSGAAAEASLVRAHPCLTFDKIRGKASSSAATYETVARPQVEIERL